MNSPVEPAPSRDPAGDRKPRSLSERVLASSFLLLLIRFVQRGLGLISTLILARLLAPDDFGLVAIVLLALQLADVLSAVGGEQYIIQKDRVDREDLDTAWSISLLSKLLLWLVVVLAAPNVAAFYDDPRLCAALRVASVVILLNGLANPGVFTLRRNMTYRLILRLAVVQKTISFAVVMLVVVIEPSHWALIAGAITSAVTFSAGSYLIHPHRPRPDLSRAGDQFGFSQWMLYRGIVGFARAQADTVLITKHFALADAGAFHLAKTLVHMPATDIVAPAVEPLLAAFARSRRDLDDLAYKFRVGMGFVIFLVAPVSIYIALFPSYLVDVLLGDQWERTHELLPYLAPLLVVLATSRVYENLCLAIGRVRDLFVYNVVVTLLLVATLFAFTGHELERFVLARTTVHLALTLAFPLYLARVLALDLPRLLALTVPIAAIAWSSGLVARLVEPHLPGGDFVRLVSTAAAFFSAYAMLTVALYALYAKRWREYRAARTMLANAATRLKLPGALRR